MNWECPFAWAAAVLLALPLGAEAKPPNVDGKLVRVIEFEVCAKDPNESDDEGEAIDKEIAYKERIRAAIDKLRSEPGHLDPAAEHNGARRRRAAAQA
jgi:hypothetical protein